MVNTLFFAPAGFTDLLGLFGVLSAVMLAASVILAILKGNAAKKGDAGENGKYMILAKQSAGRSRSIA